MQHTEVVHRFEAPRAAVWAAYADFPGWTQWAGLGRVTLEREGSPDPSGVGAIRVFTNLGYSVREEILDVDPGRRLVYTVLSGFSVRDHEGEVLFEDDGEGTRVTWRVQFRSGLPGLGGLIRVTVAAVFRRTLRRLARHLQAR